MAKTVRLFGTIHVDRPLTTTEGAVETTLPSVENHQLNVDDSHATVDQARHNMLWLINATERYMLWFWP
jgi:hypothetical protein